MASEIPPRPKPTIVLKPWERGLGPYYIGLFLWVVFFDQLGARTLAVGGLGWSCLGVLLAGPLCYLLLFRIPADWGHATGKTLPELAEGTFGRSGARWIPGALLGLGAVVWFAVSVSYATDLTFRALSEAGLLDGRSVRPVRLGGIRLLSPLMLATSLFWSVAACLVGRWLVRVIAAIMYVFPVFPALILGGTMLAMLGGLRGFAPTGIDPLTHVAIPMGRAGVWSMLLIVQMILGFFAMSGVAAADWGAATTTARDVRLGGWVGACLAPIVIATIGLIAEAGYQGRLDAPPAEVPRGRPADPISLRNRAMLSASRSEIRSLGTGPALTYREVLTDGIGGRVGCALMLIVGVGALAPAVYAAFVFGHRFHATFLRLSRTRWTLIGTALSWPMVITGAVDRLETVFTVMGALFVPVAACLAADHRRHGGRWSGPRLGVSRAGLAGWAVGVAVGLLPLLPGRMATFQPAAFWAFLAAFGTYQVAVRLGGEPEVIEVQQGPTG